MNPALGRGVPRAFAIIGLTAVLTLLNYRGLTVVSWVAICLGVFFLPPFFVMGLIALPKLRAARWLVIDLHNNLNYWDSINTLAGEVKNPGKTLPKALFYVVIFVVVAYLYPLLAGTGAVSLNRGQWTDGYFADITKLLGDAWLMWWVQSAAALSNMGIFVAEMSSDSTDHADPIAEKSKVLHLFLQQIFIDYEIL
uniref:Amino acid permease/ SLC12A domain-containing protein n=1 Tax=Oryza glumipatula TaxID=40148 RepID=A0A0D9YKA4_9ORYZ